jgi:peptidoglycan-associated lipoprotein
MKKHYLLTALLAVFVSAFFGCSSDGSNTATGPGLPYDDSEEGAQNEAINDPSEGSHPNIDGVTFGKFTPIHFDTDSASIKAGDRAKIAKVGEYMNSNPGAKILIAGNCDDRGTSEYNRALGQRRAQAARSILVRQGIPAERISTVSYGEDKPVGSLDQNRRDDFGIID